MSDQDSKAAVELVARSEGWSADELGAVPMEAPFFHAWRFWRVQTGTIPPALRFVATNNAQAVPIKVDEGFGPLVAIEPLAIPDPESALAHVRFFLSVTMDRATVLSSVDEIFGLRAEGRSRWAEKVGPPEAKVAAWGYQVDLWLAQGGDLLRGDFAVDKQGKINVRIELVEERVGVRIPCL